MKFIISPIDEAANVKISVSGLSKATKKLKPLFQDLVTYAMSDVGVTSVVKVELYIELGRTKGSTPLLSMEQISSMTEKTPFILRLNLYENVDMVIEALVHELTHIKQTIDKDIQFDGNTVSWKGKPIISTEDYDVQTRQVYLDFPWEVDARKKQKPLAEKLVKKHFNQLKDKHYDRSEECAIYLDEIADKYNI